MSLSVITSGVERYDADPEISVVRNPRGGGGIQINWEASGRKTATVQFFDKNQSYRPARGEPISITDGVTTFYGLITRITEKREGDDLKPPLSYRCECTDYTFIFDRRLVFRTYPSGTLIFEIFSDLATNVLSGEGFDTTNVSGAGFISDDLKFDGATVRQVLDQITELCNEHWWLAGTAGKSIYSKPLTSAPRAPFDITDSSENWMGVEIEWDFEGFANVKHVRANISLAQGGQVDTWPGDGASFFFPTHFPMQSAPTVTVNSVPKTVYERGVDANGQDGWYWIRGGYGVTHGLSTPVPLGQNIVISYGSYQGNVVSVRNEASIAARAAIEGGTGISESIEDVPNIDSVDVADDLATAALTRATQLPTTIRYRTDSPGLTPGMAQAVQLLDSNIDTLTSPPSYFYVLEISSVALERPVSAGGGLTWDEATRTWADATETWGYHDLYFRHTVRISTGLTKGSEITWLAAQLRPKNSSEVARAATAVNNPGPGLTNTGDQVAVNPGAGIDTTGNTTNVKYGIALEIDGSGFLRVKLPGGAGVTADASGLYIPAGGITNTFLGALSVATGNIQDAAIATAKIANGAVGTTQIANAAITTALIANAAITTALIGTAQITTALIANAAITSALIANLAVANAHINDVAASKITAGTISASISITAPTINGGTITGATLSLTSGSITMTFDSTNYITVSNSSGSNRKAIHQYAYFRVENPTTTYDFSQMDLGAITISRESGGSPGGRAALQATPTGTILTMSHNGGSTAEFEIDTTNITSATASAGLVTLPSNPVNFLIVKIQGTSRKIPYYAT